MGETEAIAERLRAVWQGPCWHGPPVRVVLDGVRAAEAAARRLDGRHSIWEIVNHISAWRESAVRGVTSGFVSVAAKDNFIAPAEISEQAWKATLARFDASAAALLDLLSSLHSSDLDRMVQGETEPYSVRFLLDGVADHDLYHAGQIRLLRKG